MINKTMAAAAAFLIVSLNHADARGWLWFVRNIKSGPYCNGQPTTYYGDGRRNADGSRFNSRGLSAASWDYPFGTVLRIMNSRNGKTVDVIVKDRGPARWIYNLGIHLDISTGAARAIRLGQNGRFESGYTCHSVVSLGQRDKIISRKHRRRLTHEELVYTRPSVSSDYMSRAGAGAGIL